MNNRRQFTRILFSMQAELAIGEHCLPVNIIDLSLNGALLCADTQEVVFSNKMGFRIVDAKIPSLFAISLTIPSPIPGVLIA